MCFALTPSFDPRERDALNQVRFSTIARDERLHQFLVQVCLREGRDPAAVVASYVK